jgi:hypothetical protein
MLTVKFVPPTQPAVDKTRLIVLEDPIQAREYLRVAEGEPACVVAKAPSESTAQLAIRTIRRIAALESASTQVTEAVLAIDESTSRQSAAARELIARTVLCHMMQRSDESQLVVAASRTAAARHQLMLLAGTLVTEAKGSGVQVVVRFGENDDSARPKSGVFARVRAE